MKHLLFIFSFLICSIATFADNASEARKTLDKVANKINLSSGATADFSILTSKGSQSGSIAIKGNKFNARTSNAIMWYNGTTQWVLNKKSNEVNVSHPSSSQQQSMNPYSFLSLYKKGYTMSQTNSASGLQVHLVGNGKSISEMYVLVDKNYNLKQVKLKQKNGWITINVSNFKSQKLSDGSFTFNSKDYPNAEVIDLR